MTLPSLPAGLGPLVPRRVLFVTGRLAEPSLRRVLEQMAPPFAYDVCVLPITVAALMTTGWIARRLTVPDRTDLVLIPGLCEGDLAEIGAEAPCRVVRGPDDVRDIPDFFGRTVPEAYGAYDIEIVAEINGASRRLPEDIAALAAAYRAAGADLVDLGCTPGDPFPGLGHVVRTLRADGCRVSVDTFDAALIEAGVEAGAELVLSINGSNLDAARPLRGTGARVVVVPDLGEALDTMDRTVSALEGMDVPYLLDPILEPIGHRFMASLERYAEVRRRYPSAEMLMGVGNLTELTAADSTGVNAVLVGICQELGIRTVLTTEVAGWTRGAVAEIDIARRLMHYAVSQRMLPKRVDDRLLTTKDRQVVAHDSADLLRLQQTLTDPNIRIFTDRSHITVLNNDVFAQGTDVHALFERLGVSDPAHAFYLGRELERASTAVLLGKTYRQDNPLSWGYLTPPPESATHRSRRLTPTRREPSQELPARETRTGGTSPTPSPAEDGS